MGYRRQVCKNTCLRSLVLIESDAANNYITHRTCTRFPAHRICDRCYVIASDRIRLLAYLARCACPPSVLYVPLMFFSLFIFNGPTYHSVISASTGPIFTKFSGSLWEALLTFHWFCGQICEINRSHARSARWRSETDCRIAVSISED